jgi:L-threonylcarbamoyladenylate synthase
MQTTFTETTAIISQLRNNAVGLIPADTLWGISGIASPEIAHRIQAIKHRESPKPLILLIYQLEQIENWLQPLTNAHQQFCDSHWPGPITLLLPASTLAPTAITCGLPTLGVRIPAIQPLRNLLKSLGHPLISTSANLAGEPAPKNHTDISRDIQAQVDFQAIWEDPPGTASQIWDLTQTIPTRVR